MKTGNHFKSGMLRKSLFILAAVILFSLLFACKKKNEGLLELDSNGKYTPVDGDLYIGIIYRFEADRDATLELYTICDASGNVSDCGKNCHTDEPFDKERYIGMNYIDAFDLFLHDHEKQVEGRKREMIDVPILEGDENRDKYSEKFGALADRNGFPHEVGFVSEDKKRFLDIIANSTEEQVRRLRLTRMHRRMWLPRQILRNFTKKGITYLTRLPILQLIWASRILTVFIWNATGMRLR